MKDAMETEYRCFCRFAGDVVVSLRSVAGQRDLLPVEDALAVWEALKEIATMEDLADTPVVRALCTDFLTHHGRPLAGGGFA